METPEFFETTYYNNNNSNNNNAAAAAAAAQFTTATADQKAKNNADHFIIDDLLDFPNDDAMDPTAAGFELTTGTSSAVLDHSEFQPGAGIGGAPAPGGDAQFATELCVPYDDMAELEWLSNFVDESFSSEDLQKLQLIQGMKQARTNEDTAAIAAHQYQFQPENEPARPSPGPLLPTEMCVPAKARSKRSRAAPGNWTSRLLVVSPQPIAAVPAASSSSESEGKRAAEGSPAGGGEGRRCLHCATDKTPQWRTGPMGPKTLCNACGVRYKSGRLVPEYRPAASPTFVLTKHSNSHRKVLELRRQKEMQRAQHHQHHQQQFLHHHQNMMFDVSNAGDDYLIHQHIGPDYRQMI